MIFWNKNEKMLIDYSGAIEDFTKVIDINPKNADSYYNRGLLLMINNQKDKGCMDLSKAGELGLSKAYEAIKINCQ